MAVGLMALWTATLPLTAAEPAVEQKAAVSPAMTGALFLCRGTEGLNQSCVTALAKAMVLDARRDVPAQVSDQRCQVNPEMLANLRRRD